MLQFIFSTVGGEVQAQHDLYAIMHTVQTAVLGYVLQSHALENLCRMRAYDFLSVKIWKDD